METFGIMGFTFGVMGFFFFAFVCMGSFATLKKELEELKKDLVEAGVLKEQTESEDG